MRESTKENLKKNFPISENLEKNSYWLNLRSQGIRSEICRIWYHVFFECIYRNKESLVN